MPPSTLYVAAVPSVHRAAIRRWIENDVATESRAWMDSLTSRSATWLDAEQRIAWLWKPVPATVA